MSESKGSSVGVPKLSEAYRRQKTTHVGAPAIFALELACQHLNQAFSDSHGCYLVGSAIERPDWRDIDVVMILPDEEFLQLFPRAHQDGRFEHDPRWLILTIAVSLWLSQHSGLPIDFKFQPQTFANMQHSGPRHAIGMRFAGRAALTQGGDNGE